MTCIVTRISHGINDLLYVDGLTDAGQEGGEPATPISARGWLSHVLNYYPPESYGEDGHRVNGAQSRRMTDSELLDYAISLLTDVEHATYGPTAARVLYTRGATV